MRRALRQLRRRLRQEKSALTVEPQFARHVAQPAQRDSTWIWRTRSRVSPISSERSSSVCGRMPRKP